jgi:hypothetical protein
LASNRETLQPYLSNTQDRAAKDRSHCAYGRPSKTQTKDLNLLIGLTPKTSNHTIWLPGALFSAKEKRKKKDGAMAVQQSSGVSRRKKFLFLCGIPLDNQGDCSMTFCLGIIEGAER